MTNDKATFEQIVCAGCRYRMVIEDEVYDETDGIYYPVIRNICFLDGLDLNTKEGTECESYEY